MSGKSTLVSLPMEAWQWGESRAWPTAHLAPVLDSNSDPVLLQPELPSDDLLGCGLRPLQGVFLQAVSHVSLPACLSAFLSLLQDHLHFAEAHFQQQLQLPHCWRGSVAGPPSGRWSSGSAPFPTEPPTANPTWACGYPRVFPLPPQPLGKLPHLFLCGQRSSGSAGIWTHCWGPCQAGEGACTPRRAWEAGPHLASSDLGPIGHHPAQEFVRQGCWRKPPSIRTWAHPRPNPRQDHHLVGPAWVLNQIGVSACPLH